MKKVICPKCEAPNLLDAINCSSCQVNFALHYPEFFKRNQSSYASSQKNPEFVMSSTNVENDKATKIEQAQQLEVITPEPFTKRATESVRMPAGTVCPECGYVNKQPRSICKQCRKSYAEMSWDKPKDPPEREAAEIPPITSEERDQIFEKVIADHEKNGFKVTKRTDTSVQMFKPKFTANDIFYRALPPGIFLFVILSGLIPISNASTARIVESSDPGWLIFIALLYAGVPFLFKKDQAIKIVVDESGNIETQDISDSISKE